MSLNDQQVQALLARVESGMGLETAVAALGLPSDATMLELKQRAGFREQYRAAKALASQ